MIISSCPTKKHKQKLGRYSDSDSPYSPPKHTSKNSTLQSPKRTHPNNTYDINSPQISQDYDPIVQNVIPYRKAPLKPSNNLAPPK